MRIVLLPATEVEVEDTWHVLGLCGTGSDHVRVDNVVVPAARTGALFAEEHAVDTTVVHVPAPTLFSLCIGTVAVGIALGALDDIGAQAAERVPLLAGAPLAASPTYHRDLATAHAAAAAVRALLHEVAEDAWSTALARREPTFEQRARWRGACAHAAATAIDVVGVAHRSGGGGAVYRGNPLQRRLRDVHTLGQHFLVRPDTFTTAGALLAGGELDVPVF
jgi:alkylation response protein AidB-like acyl-CoA dehydrogenase